MRIAQNLKLNQREIKIAKGLRQEIFSLFKFKMIFDETKEWLMMQLGCHLWSQDKRLLIQNSQS